MTKSMTNPNSRSAIGWLSLLPCLFMVLTAAVMAFPRLIGSNDEPSAALTIAFLALAVVLGITALNRWAGNDRSTGEKVMDKTTEFSVDQTQSEDHGSRPQEDTR